MTKFAFLVAGTALLFSSAVPAETGETSVASPIEASPFFLAIAVADVERSTDWYGRVFGFEVVRSIDIEARGIRIRLLRNGSAFLELGEFAAARALDEIEPPVEKRYELHGVFKHGFLADDLDEIQERLAALGVPLRGDVVTESDGSFRSLQIEDPDGNVIQVFQALTP